MLGEFKKKLNSGFAQNRQKARADGEKKGRKRYGGKEGFLSVTSTIATDRANKRRL